MSAEKVSISKLSEYRKQGFNRVPLVREVLADLDTPLSTYLKLANAPYTYLFESVHGGEKWGRYSIIGLPCKKVIKISGYEISQYEDDKLINKAIQIGHYQNAQKAIDTILSDYIQSHQKQNTPFDKLCFELDMDDQEIDGLFQRDKDTGRTVDL